MANNSVSTVYSLLIIAGGLIGIVGVFLAWIDLGGIYSVSGWEIIRESLDNPSLSGISDDYVKWMPLIVLVFSVIGLLCGIASAAKPNKVVGAGTILCGIFAIIAVIVFWTYSWGPFHMSDYIGTGVYLAAAGGALLVIFGALRASVN